MPTAGRAGGRLRVVVMAVVHAVEGRGGTRGVLIDAYGTYADPAVGAKLGGAR